MSTACVSETGIPLSNDFGRSPDLTLRYTNFELYRLYVDRIQAALSLENRLRGCLGLYPLPNLYCQSYELEIDVSFYTLPIIMFTR